MKMAVKASPASRTLPATLATVRVVTVQPMGFHLEHLPNEKSGACSHPYVRPLCVTATINGSKLQVKSSGGETCESSPSSLSLSQRSSCDTVLMSVTAQAKVILSCWFSIAGHRTAGKLLVRSPSISGLFQPTTSITLISS
jgi:hypothetical protein